ncbi:MAG: cell wall hydrolase [Bdellovibrio sp.]|nr:cell wall hydrolase [Bdellovibrio sp.]
MRFFVALLLLQSPASLAATSSESSVYVCRFEEDPNGFSSLRMKKYFDFNENMELGKVDLIQNFMVVESTPTKVYQIPLLDNKTYVQMWHSANLLVDAHLSYAQGHQEFRATYKKDSQSKKILCVELQP